MIPVTVLPMTLLQTLNLTSDKALVSHLPMKNVAQLLYKTFMNYTADTAVSADSSQAFLMCFREVSHCENNPQQSPKLLCLFPHSFKG